MDVYQHQLTKYDIPLDHLDYEYIKRCDDVSEIEKIIKLLRSKEEGDFPEMEKLAEERLEKLKPKSKLLWKASKLLSSRDLNEEERDALDSEFKEWEERMRSADEDLTTKSSEIEFDDLPPVRCMPRKVIVENHEKEETQATTTTSNKRIKPRDYVEWDKLDIEAELNKVDKEKKMTPSKLAEKINIEEDIGTVGLSEQLKAMKAEREKNKGNESFKAGDHVEALAYYNRSLSIMKNVPAYNNRAQIYLNKKKWNQAIEDCNSVLTLDPSNVKAHLRRAVGYQGLTQYMNAQKDLHVVLVKEPANKQALTVLNEVKHKLTEQKVSGKRMNIEEVDGSDDDEDDDKLNNLNGASNDDEKLDDNNVSSHDNKDNTGIKQDNNGPIGDVVNQLNGDGGSNSTSIRVRNGSGDAEVVDEKPWKSIDECRFKNKVSTMTDRVESQPTQSFSSPSELTKQPPQSLPSPESTKQSSSPPLFSPSPRVTSTLTLKDKADALFKIGQYGEAAEKYKESLDILGDPSLDEEWKLFDQLNNNKATSSLKSGNLASCIKDCDAILSHNPANYEAIFKKALAYDELENYKQAYVHYKCIPPNDVNVKVARRSSDRCASMLNKLLGPDWRNKLPLFPVSPSFQINPPPSSAAQPTSPLPPDSSSPPPPSSDVSQPLSESSSSTGIAQLPSPPPLSSSSSSHPQDQEKMSRDDLHEQLKATGNSLFIKGAFKEAIQCFTKCIEMKGDGVVPHTNRALCYLRLHQYDMVLEDCNQALMIDFQCTKALYRRAVAFKMKGDFEKGLIDLETLLKIDPRNSAARKELNNVNNILQQIEERKAKDACTRKEKSRQRINITDVTTQYLHHKCIRDDKPSQVKTVKKTPMPTIATVTKTKTTKSVKPTVSTSKGTSAYEFMQAYNAVKSSEDISALVEVFDILQPSRLPSVLSNKLDSDMFVIITKCINHYFLTGQKEKAIGCLENFVLVERFDIIAMFLSNSDREVVNGMFEQASEFLSKDFLGRLRLKFKL